MYNNANWEKANDLLAATDWQLLITGDIDESWDNWQKRFLEVMQECIPQKTLPPRHNLPWLSKSLVQLMRKRNQLFSQAKRSKREVDLAKYRKMRNRLVFSQLQSAKANYFKRINPHDAEQFWMMLQLVVIKRKLTWSVNILLSALTGTYHLLVQVSHQTLTMCMTWMRSSFSLLMKSSIF